MRLPVSDSLGRCALLSPYGISVYLAVTLCVSEYFCPPSITSAFIAKIIFFPDFAINFYAMLYGVLS